MRWNAKTTDYAVRVAVVENPDCDAGTIEAARDEMPIGMHVEFFETFDDAVARARSIHRARPFGIHVCAEIEGPDGEVTEVSPNGRLWAKAKTCEAIGDVR